MDATEYPSWMKQHLRKRLEESKREQARTGPVNGEPALVANDKGKVETIITDHKPPPPKNGFHEGAEVLLCVEGRLVTGRITCNKDALHAVQIDSVIGPVYAYRYAYELRLP